VPTSDDSRFYAFLRSFEGELALAVFNFQPTAEQMTLNLAGQPHSILEDLRSGEHIETAQKSFPIDLPAYGTRFFRMIPID
jgi:hypothetical protein